MLTVVVAALCPSLALSASPAAAAAAATVAAAAVEPDGVWPLSPTPQVVAGFDPPARRWEAGHRGVDLAGRLGQPVHAALAGSVTYAGRLAGRGVVVVDHGSTRTTYEPVAATVSVGDRVGAGEQIGRLELFGSHCFPRVCLHWGLIEGRDHYLDPLTLVGAAPVILLPLFGVGAGASAAGPRGRRGTAAGVGRPVGIGPPAVGVPAGGGALTRRAPLLPPVAAAVAAPPFLWAPARQARGWAWR